MTLSITLPNELVDQLQREAQAQQRSVQDVALDILAQALGEVGLTPEEVVAKAKALPPNPKSLRPAQGSLAEALRHAPLAPEFDAEQWTRAWAVVEAEMDAIEKADDLADETYLPL